MCYFIWDTVTKSNRLFSPDCDFQHRPVQATMFKVPLPWDFLRIHRDVPVESQTFPFPWSGGIYWFVLALDYDSPLTRC